MQKNFMGNNFGSDKLNFSSNWEYKKKILKNSLQKLMLDTQDLYSIFSDQAKVSYTQPKNLRNLELIKQKYGPATFYGVFVKTICQFALEYEKDIYQQRQQIVTDSKIIKLTRRQCCQLISLMMLQALKQTTSSTSNIVNFSTLYENSSSNRNQSNFGKLDCIFNYILTMAENQQNLQFMSEQIIIKRNQQNNLNLYGKMNSVQLDKYNPIQYYQSYAQVSFANKHIGGGVLNNGSLQEEIYFATCPEMIVSLLFSETLQDNESIVFQNVYRYTNYTGYASSFQCTGKNLNYQKPLEIISIDSINYSRYDSSTQFQTQMIEREIKKAYCGFSSVDNNKIATGNWGCGDFKSEPQLKFLIQWIACSLSQKQMFYCSFGERKLQNAQQIINLLQNQSIEQVMQQLKMLKKCQYSVFEQILYNYNNKTTIYDRKQAQFNNQIQHRSYSPQKKLQQQKINYIQEPQYQQNSNHFHPQYIQHYDYSFQNQKKNNQYDYQQYASPKQQKQYNQQDIYEILSLNKINSSQHQQQTYDKQKQNRSQSSLKYLYTQSQQRNYYYKK